MTDSDDFKSLKFRCRTNYGTSIWSDPQAPRLEQFDHALDARQYQVWGDPTTGYTAYKPMLPGIIASRKTSKSRKRHEKDRNEDQGSGPYFLS
jgi:hypothetical protein